METMTVRSRETVEEESEWRGKRGDRESRIPVQLQSERERCRLQIRQTHLQAQYRPESEALAVFPSRPAFWHVNVVFRVSCRGLVVDGADTGQPAYGTPLFLRSPLSLEHFLSQAICYLYLYLTVAKARLKTYFPKICHFIKDRKLYYNCTHTAHSK